jgi:hypothetical protein
MAVSVDRAWFDDEVSAVVYRLCVDRPTQGRTMQKRFSDFLALYNHVSWPLLLPSKRAQVDSPAGCAGQLVLRIGADEIKRLGLPPFPRKKLLGNRDASLIESRRLGFER